MHLVLRSLAKYDQEEICMIVISAGCNILSPKICFLKETKDINVEVFNTITNKNEAKTMTKHISCDCKCKSNSIL